MEVHLSVERLQQFLSGLVIVQGCEIQGVAIRYAAELVLVVSRLVGELSRRIILVIPDVQGLNAPGEGVADDAAIPAGDFHDNLAGVEQTQDVRVYVHAPVGFTEYGLSVNRLLHSVHGF